MKLVNNKQNYSTLLIFSFALWNSQTNYSSVARFTSY